MLSTAALGVSPQTQLRWNRTQTVIEPTTSPTPKKRTAAFAVLAITAIVIAVVGYKYYLNQKIVPVTSLHNVHLGMREVDATLAYGRSPDCDGREDQLTKEIVFHANNPCSTSLTFQKENGATTLTKICRNDGFAPVYIDNFRAHYLESDESAILRNLGNPSDVSISQDGTRKVLSFSKFNVAFAIRGGSVEVYCVTQDLPLRFVNEYASPAIEG